jgi:hypothetical protein
LVLALTGNGTVVGCALRWARRLPKQAESNGFGNLLSSIILERLPQRRINQAF